MSRRDGYTKTKSGRRGQMLMNMARDIRDSTKRTRVLGIIGFCNTCMQKGQTTLHAMTNGRTSQPKTHVQKEHSSLLGIESMETSNLETGTRQQQTIHESPRKAVISKVAGQSFRDTLLGWLADANIPFAGIEHPLFRQLLCLLNRELVQELLPATRV
jgi:hypothetical protein